MTKLTVEEIKSEIKRCISFYDEDLSGDSESDWTVKRFKALLDWIEKEEKERK